MGDINKQLGQVKAIERAAKANTIFRLRIETYTPVAGEPDKITSSVITVVDLAGSESLAEEKDSDRGSSVTSMARETSFANRSINTLDTIVSILTEGNEMNEWIPYRDSKLTKLLMT